MAYNPNCRISVGRVIVRSVHSLTIESTWQELSDICTIQIPNRGVVQSSKQNAEVELDDLIKVGDPVRVELGYNDNFHSEFVGYVRAIQPGTPITIECEDEVYNLKRKPRIKNNFGGYTLATLLKEVTPGITIGDVPKLSFNNFLIEDLTPAQVLQEIREKYGLAIYYRQGKLFAGLPYTERIERNEVFVIHKNVISESLEYQNADDVSLRVKAISVLSDNKKIQVEVGDKEGELRTLYYYNVTSEAELRKMAVSDLSKYKYSGYSGTIDIFGTSFVEHTEVVQVSDPRYTGRDGNYIVEKVTTKFGQNGFRRTLKLGIKV